MGMKSATSKPSEAGTYKYLFCTGIYTRQHWGCLRMPSSLVKYKLMFISEPATVHAESKVLRRFSAVQCSAVQSFHLNSLQNMIA